MKSMDKIKNFEGMTALVTGASSGIGAATATAFGAPPGIHVLPGARGDETHRGGSARELVGPAC